MKIQYIAVIFIIIALPISMVTAYYIGTQIDTIKLQIKYNEKLTTSTYDAITAFQINTTNNRYSSVSDSKIRDIEAAVSTFFNSLSSNEKMTVEELKSYVPAIVFTLYDGYYIYSKFDNAYPINNGQPDLNPDVLNSESHESDGLKPYIYYSCRYQKGSTDFVVNYTLDNAITIYGTFPGKGYKTLSGYLINPKSVTINNDDPANPLACSLTYSGVTIGPELLTEHLLFSNGEQKDYEYLVYNGQKIYYDKDKTDTDITQTKYFFYQNYDKTYITISSGNGDINNYLNKRTENNHLYSTSSFEYYKTAKKFSEEVASLTSGITQADAKDENGNTIEFTVDTGTESIFVTSNTNDPLISGSAFDENRRQVIKRAIETNLTAAIAQYSVYNDSFYEFALPKLEETDWDKITNKVSVISFMQGIPIGHKYYNNYCVITNDSNEETINKENIYIITENTITGEKEYHLPGCKELLKPESQTNLRITLNGYRSGNYYPVATAYSNLSFIRQTVRISEGNYKYFYPQTRVSGSSVTTLTACYHCIVNAAVVYSPDQIIQGKIIEKDIDGNDQVIADVSSNERLREIREYYIKALARERYDLYRYNIDSFSEF